MFHITTSGTAWKRRFPEMAFPSPLVSLLLIMATNVIASKNHEQQGITKVDVAVNGPLLLNELLLDYDSFTRPGAGDHPSRIQVGLKPSFVTWKDDQLKAAFTLEHIWIDERLKFTGDKELKLSDVNTRLWLPDTMFRSLESHPTMHGLLTIQPQGLVHWVQQVLVTFPCPLEPSEVWTNDGVINCTLRLSSRAYSANDLEYIWAQDKVDLSKTGGSKQLQKVEFLGEHEETAYMDFFNTTSWDSVQQPVVTGGRELKVVFTVQTDFTKSVLRYLTKKAMRDL